MLQTRLAQSLIGSWTNRVRQIASSFSALSFSALSLGLMVAGAPAIAADVFVVDAKGIDLALGAKLDGSKPLSLALGQRLTLVTADGRTIKLKGPSELAPAPEAENVSTDVASSLKGLIKAREADTTSAGIIRKGSVDFTQPTPWLVEVTDSGDRCLIGGEKTVLWRQDKPAAAGDLEISPVDHSWSANASWPAGSDKLSLPENLQLHNGQAYVVNLDGTSANLTIHVIPATVKSDAAKAAWMIEVGCESQAKALVEAIR